MVCELSKCMVETKMTHYKLVLCEIKYVDETYNQCRQMKPEIKPKLAMATTL